MCRAARDADVSLVTRPLVSLAPGPTVKGRALFPRGRASEFRFPDRAPGQPRRVRQRRRRGRAGV